VRESADDALADGRARVVALLVAPVGDLLDAPGVTEVATEHGVVAEDRILEALGRPVAPTRHAVLGWARVARRDRGSKVAAAGGDRCRPGMPAGLEQEQLEMKREQAPAIEGQADVVRREADVDELCARVGDHLERELLGPGDRLVRVRF
jgi:hypothetical protein